MRELFSSAKNESQRLKESITTMEAAAQFAARDDAIEKGKKFAQEMEFNLARLKACREMADTDGAAWYAMKACECWMMLRADAAFAISVYKDKKTRANLRKSSPAVTAAQILEDARQHPGTTRTQQSKRLGIAPRTIRNTLRGSR
jgi:hypothetical protein